MRHNGKIVLAADTTGAQTCRRQSDSCPGET
jgi:hypothetical protein